jgi:ABC-2 type transport system permease protein
MKKYLLIAKNTWDEMLTYRLNFSMYRLRMVLGFLTMYYLWYALLPENGILFGYSQKLLLTYMFGTAIMQAFILSSRSYAIGDDINQGNLSNYLIKPLNYFLYWFAKDMGDKAMNITFAVVELSLLFLFLRPPFLIQTDVLYLCLFFLAAVFSMFLYFLLNLILGMIGFWSPEIWAPRFIFMILIGFFSGTYLPLDIFPRPVFAFMQLLPFQYLLYFPLKIYLKQLPLLEVIHGLLIAFIWLIGLFIIVQWIWKRGLQVYTAQGR